MHISTTKTTHQMALFFVPKGAQVKEDHLFYTSFIPFLIQFIDFEDITCNTNLEL